MQCLRVQACVCNAASIVKIVLWIIIGSDRRPETKQGTEGKIDRFRSGRVWVRDKDGSVEKAGRGETVHVEKAGLQDSLTE